jgi:hypothetical protein
LSYENCEIEILDTIYLYTRVKAGQNVEKQPPNCADPQHVISAFLHSDGCGEQNSKRAGREDGIA